MIKTIMQTKIQIIAGEYQTNKAEDNIWEIWDYFDDVNEYMVPNKSFLDHWLSGKSCQEKLVGKMFGRQMPGYFIRGNEQ